MKFYCRSIALILSVVFTSGTLSPAWAQSSQDSVGQSAVPLVESSRVGGSSFGILEREGQKNNNSSQNALGIPPGAIGSGRVGMGSTLMYQVHILGEVQQPGTYRVMASSRLSEALQQAGGMLDRGSSRHIELRREGGGRVVDLMDFKVRGNLDANPYLLDNDVIFVPLKERVVQIVGTVKRPGNYEILKNENSLAQVVKLAGGFTPGIQTDAPIRILRFEKGVKQIIKIPNTESDLKQTMIRHADVIIAPHFITEKKEFDYNLTQLPGDNQLFYPSYEERVFVIGAVARAGPYPYSPYYNVRQYLTIAGGTTKLAKIRKIRILTSQGKSEKATAKVEINPGDTIVVPEKYMAPESAVTLVLSLVAGVLGVTNSILFLTR